MSRYFKENNKTCDLNSRIVEDCALTIESWQEDDVETGA